MKLDLTSVHCISLELQFFLELPEPVRQELSALGARESEEDEDCVFFHEDYRQESSKLHSWGEVRIAGWGESEVAVEYLAESELEDQTELHHTDFTLSHLFSALTPIESKVTAAFTFRFDLGAVSTARFLRRFPYNTTIKGGLAC